MDEEDEVPPHPKQAEVINRFHTIGDKAMTPVFEVCVAQCGEPDGAVYVPVLVLAAVVDNHIVGTTAMSATEVGTDGIANILTCMLDNINGATEDMWGGAYTRRFNRDPKSEA